MAEWVLIPVVQALVGKVTDALIQRVTNIWGVEDDRRELENQLGCVRSLLAHAERKAEEKTEAGRAVKLWMKKLKAVSYQAEDVLDHFRYEAEGGDASRQVSYLSRDGPAGLGSKARAYHKASSVVLAKINELVVEMNTFGLLKIPDAAPQDVCRQTHSALDDSTEIFGRDVDKKKVVELLLKEQEDQKGVQVLPIIGMGGLGKTTLAKMVYNDHTVQKHFELKVWCCVSENFEATTILRSMGKLDQYH